MAPQAMSVSAVLARRAAMSGTDRAVIADDGNCDFAGLEAGAARMAAAFAGLGVEPGDRVGLLLPAGLGFAQAFFALARLGAIACPLNTRLGAGELADIVTLSGLQLLLHHDQFATIADAVLVACPDVQRQEFDALIVWLTQRLWLHIIFVSQRTRSCWYSHQAPRADPRAS